MVVIYTSWFQGLKNFSFRKSWVILDHFYEMLTSVMYLFNIFGSYMHADQPKVLAVLLYWFDEFLSFVITPPFTCLFSFLKHLKHFDIWDILISVNSRSYIFNTLFHLSNWLCTHKITYLFAIISKSSDCLYKSLVFINSKANWSRFLRRTISFNMTIKSIYYCLITSRSYMLNNLRVVPSVFA